MYAPSCHPLLVRTPARRLPNEYAGIGALIASRGTSPPLIIGGTLGTAIGMLFLGPLAIRALAAGRARMPVPVRLALSDLVRYQARSGAALAAIRQ